MKIHTCVCTAIAVLTLVALPCTLWAEEETQSERFTTSDGIELHYVDAGSGSPIVFVPGWTMPGWIWEHQIRYFTEGHRVIALDPRGQGASDKPAFGYDHARRARDIGELLSHLDAEPVVLVGWSLGVFEVMKYLEAEGTDAVRAVVLVDWAMHYKDPGIFAGRYVALQTNREEWTRSFVRAIYRSEQSDDYLEKVTQASLDTPTNAAAIMIGNIILQGETDLRPFMDTFDLPALFVYSSNNWSVAAAEEIRTAWPRFLVEVIEDTSHTLFVDKPDEFNGALEAFLETLQEK